MTSRWLRDVKMVMRLTRDFRSFYATPITGKQAAETIEHQLATRHERFLGMVEQLIFRHARSPYLPLLRAAGCELGDIRKLVAREGVEGALRDLCAAGVYVSFDEFKGRKDVVRGSQRFAVAEPDFDNPDVSGHMETQTGGTRGLGTPLKLGLAFIADRALATALAYEAHGLNDYDGALWQVSALRPILQYTKAGKTPIAWFYPVKPLPLTSHAIMWYLRALGTLFGHAVPRPVFLDLQDPGRMALWLARRAHEGKPICLTANASSAVRVCAAAKAMGLILQNVAFIVIGEPYTEARKKVVEDAGARALVGYGFNEAGTVGFGCREPLAPDDVHWFSNAYGLIQQRRRVGDSSLAVDSFLVTSFLVSGPKVLLNVESGDYGIVETRSCGCRFGELGLNTHLREIRSFEKLTTEGMTFVKTDLLRILEDVLPARFGGASTDYQLVEEAREGGLGRLVLIVSPRLGAIDEGMVLRAFFDELKHGAWSEWLMAQTWERAGTVIVRRQEPVVTKAGKILPFHVTRRLEPHRDAAAGDTG
jgi:hypothetical protein